MGLYLLGGRAECVKIRSMRERHGESPCGRGRAVSRGGTWSREPGAVIVPGRLLLAVLASRKRVIGRE